MAEKHNKKQKPRATTKRKNLAWTVALSVMSGTILGLAFLLYSTSNAATNYASSLESTYQKSYYEFADKVNNIEVKLSKTVSSNDGIYTEKVLNEISKNCEDAQNNLNNLPVNMNGVEETLKFINQLGGYSQSLAQKLSKGGTITEAEKTTLSTLLEAVRGMQDSLNQMNKEMWNGYSIMKDGLKMEGELNGLTLNLQAMKGQDIDYPTMIYDGPFSDSQILQEVLGLKGQADISSEQALEKVSQIFEVDSADIEFSGEVNSNFTTYDFTFKKDGISFFAQITKQGGKLLTLSSYNDTRQVNINKAQALEIAQAFLKKNELNDLEVVWSDTVGQDLYFNFAPVQNEVIIYPDLVKVKVDLASKQVIGFEATSYYTHHTDRTLGNFAVSKQQARLQVGQAYTISTVKKALSPIDFEEILTWEIKAIKNGSIYYFFVDAQTGQLVNILKVIHTTNGNKLM